MIYIGKGIKATYAMIRQMVRGGRNAKAKDTFWDSQRLGTFFSNANRKKALRKQFKAYRKSYIHHMKRNLGRRLTQEEMTEVRVAIMSNAPVLKN